MLTLRKVAITGGLSCGKSSVCRFFKELGAQVISADEIVHQLLSLKTSLGQQVIALLGEKIVVNDKIDRSAIAKIVFNNPALLQSLQKLIHPVVFSEIEKQYQQSLKQGKAPLFVAEIPLLFEAHGGHFFDATIAVWAEPNACRQRFIAAGHNEDEYDQRMAFQLSADEKVKLADYVINNSGNLEQTRHAVADLFAKLTSPFKGDSAA